MMQQTAVALIVLAALAFAAWRFMPARWCRPLAARLAARLGLRPRAATPGGCSGCQGCGQARACGPAARQQLAAPGSQAPEIKPIPRRKPAAPS